MKKRIVSAFLALFMAFVLLPPAAQAVGDAMKAQNIQEISKTQYRISPDVTEYEWLLNNSTLTEQMVGHVMEIKVGTGSTASIAVGYGDDDIETIKSGKNWQMAETTSQAQSMQNRRGTNVVGAINAGGYDMSNGRPSGAFIMSGTLINAPTYTTFWIDKSGAAHITSAQECNAAFAAGNVLEAVASFGDIFENGHARSGLDDVTRASRTAIGIKADGTVVMLMVDGRQAPYSVGMTMAEVAAAMEELGCVQAVNLDGGGSSTFATQREGEEENSTAGLTLRCRPSDGYERKVSNTIMVLSTAKATGEFDHAAITPNDEVYTPGSSVQFKASGADTAGGHADIPAGASWTVLSGGGSISADGLYTPAASDEGDVTVGLTYNGQTVGQTTVHMRWPDKLGFTNTSVSIDFGGESDLTFKPTWQGREVHYKDGDFVWSLDETKPISYKYNALVEEKAWEGRDVSSVGFPKWKYSDSNGKIYMSLVGNLGTRQKIEWGSTETRTYYTYFTETTRTVGYENGTIQIGTVLTHDKAEMLDMRTNTWTECTAEQNAEYVNLEHVFTVGSFAGNTFTADKNNSLRAMAKVSLANNAAVTGEVELVVGLEPLVLMDFENTSGYNWNTYITNRKNGDASTGDNATYGQLTNDHITTYGMWVRTATKAAVDFDGSGVVSASEDERVRFGEKAFKLCYSFDSSLSSSAAAADAGFSCDLYVEDVQPTKIGMWVNVPSELKGCPYLLKAIMAGGASNKAAAKTDGGYNILNADKTFTYCKDGTLPSGTTMYTQYYGKAYDEKKNEITLTTLGDMAGRGWIWVEADISSMQMPINVYRAYTFRVVKTATMPECSSGHILVDNVQFIYGTNTNDVTNPVLESITETSSGTVLAADGSTVLSSGNLSFSAVYSDSELTDKYATGIDTSGIRVLLDGVDHTSEVEINNGSLYLTGMNLRNGTHTITVRLKDFYGNVTTESRSFLVEDAVGTEAGIAVLPQPEAPEVGKKFSLWIVNQTGESLDSAELVIDMPAKYLTGAEVESLDSSYQLTLDTGALSKGQARITISKPAVQTFSAQSASYDYVSEIGCLVLTMPADAATDAALKYTITKGDYTTVASDGTQSRNSFSGTEQTIALTAQYKISCAQAIAGLPAIISVTDANGSPVTKADVYSGGTKIGTTNLRGQLTHTFTASGDQTIYAVKDGVRSWETRVTVCSQTNVNDGKPYGILTNGTENPSTCQSISWLSSIGGSADAKAQVRYGLKEDLSDAQPLDGTSELLSFDLSKDAVRSSRVRLTGLEPGTTYYYQVGDGANWSETLSFRTTGAQAQTNFFILGDIQTSSTANLAAALNKLKEQSFDFGIQTGDAIDKVGNYQDNWNKFFTTLNAESLNGADLIHTLGNHEYDGDAEGKISGTIYDLPASAQNSWYKMEYGNVCVVVVNNGAKLSEALADIADDLKTDCIWKVLVAHEPIYGTNPTSASDSPEVLAAIEKAKFDFVFGGDDHAYARTEPMLGGEKTDDERNGVVYYVCGDLSSKSNEYQTRSCYAVSIPHVDYDGMYMTAEAGTASITIRAYKYDGTLLDEYTKTRTNCELGKHTITSESLYDMASHTAQCTICGQYAAVPDTFSQLLSTTDGKHVILVNGQPLTGEFRPIGAMYHACADGYAYAATAKYNGTCTTSGTTTYTCPSCAATYNTAAQMPNGHQWDGNHICTVCGFHGIDISSSAVDVQLGTPENPIGKDAVGYRYNYNPNGTIPYFYAKYGDTLLNYSRGDGLVNGKIVDLFVEYQNNKQVGKATVKLHGRGDYYGEVQLHYYIYPKKPSGLKASKVMDTYANLTWGISAGADSYELYRYDSAQKQYVLLANVGNTTGYTVTGLNMESTYHLIVRGKKTVDGTDYYSGYSNALKVTTNAASADVQTVTASVDGQSIGLSDVNGTQYLFLPASADLTKLPLRFEASENKGALVLSGDKSSLTLDAAEQSVDLTALASETDGCYVVTARIGGGDALTVRVMQGTGIPTLYLTSDDENQARVWVDAAKTNKATGTARMTSTTGTTLYNGALKQIKARGNSTFLHAEKKSYQIKLSSGADLLGTGEQVKTWVLLAGYFDATQMHDKLVKDLAAQLGMPYTASCGWVNLYYDGEYRGVYLLSEKNAINKTSVNINDLEKEYEQLYKLTTGGEYGTNMNVTTGTNKYGCTVSYTTNLTDPINATNGTGGYLLEMNYHTMEEASCFMTMQGYAINVKSPEWCGKDAMDYISAFYQGFEDAVYASDASGKNSEGKYYYDYVDLDSLVRTFVLQELAKNCDGFRYSQFFYFTNGKLYAGPVWDQEMTFGSGWSGYSRPDSMEYFDLGDALIRIPSFKAAVAAYYSTFRSAASALESRISAQYAALNDSAAMNYTLWPYIRVGDPDAAGHFWQGASYGSVVNDLQSWIAKRLSKLDEVYAGIPEVTRGDVNGDGEVDMMDVRKICEHIASITTLTDTQLKSADVNADGEVDMMDVRWICEYIVGIRDANFVKVSQ